MKTYTNEKRNTNTSTIFIRIEFDLSVESRPSRTKSHSVFSFINFFFLSLRFYHYFISSVPITWWSCNSAMQSATHKINHNIAIRGCLNLACFCTCPIATQKHTALNCDFFLLLLPYCQYFIMFAERKIFHILK